MTKYSARALSITLLAILGALFLRGDFAFSTMPLLHHGQPERCDVTAFPVRWNLNPATGNNISGDNTVAYMLDGVFNTWKTAPNAFLPIERGADVTVDSLASSPSDINLICFVCNDADVFTDSSTLAITITTAADAVGIPDGHKGHTRYVGQVLKADILFNPTITFTTGGTSGTSLRSVATHEAGHFFGLGHSAVVRAVMFPYTAAPITLSYDDAVGLSSLYPKKHSIDVQTGTISGKVTLAGAGVFGAHVFAESVTNQHAFPGEIRKTPVGALTRPDGTYSISGLPIDSYVVVAEPMHGRILPEDVVRYANEYGQPAVQTNFTARWH